MSDRNNSDKLGAPEAPSSFVNNPVQKPSDPFAFLKETMLVDLPSKGRFYKDDPFLSKGSVEIYFMDAHHEDILSNKNYIRKNTMIDKFLKEILVENVDTNKLVSADRTAIMYEARKAAYGDTFKSKVKCGACGSNNELEISLDDVVISEGENFENAFLTEDNTVKIKLPVATDLLGRDFFVEMRITDGLIENKIKSILDKKDSGFTDVLGLLITKVDGNPDISNKLAFLKVMRAKDSLFIKEYYKKVCPSIVLTHDFVCSSPGCGNEQEDMEVSISANFFWPEL